MMSRIGPVPAGPVFLISETMSLATKFEMKEALVSSSGQILFTYERASSIVLYGRK